VKEVKKRHWALTLYLVFEIVILSIGFVSYRYIGGSMAYTQTFPNAPGWAFPVLRYICLFHIMCIGAIFRWKKWGFWGAVASSLVAVVINIMMDDKLIENITGLISIAILYGVLQIGGERKGWTQLA